MKTLDGFSLYAKNFKCFGDSRQGFEEFRRINLVIGRNNTGKSALLDLVRYAVEPFELGPYMHKGRNRPQLTTDIEISKAHINQAFPDNTSGGGIPGPSHRHYGEQLVGRVLEYDLATEGKDIQWFLKGESYNHAANRYLENIVREFKTPFSSWRFALVSAERNISIEAESVGISLNADGVGATNILQQVLNDSDKPSELVEVQLRDDLNTIMGPDAQFTRISTQRKSGVQWSVYLDEKNKGRISLSDSGSGLKTIILVLLNMLVMPRLLNADPAKYVFAFEELENNLHPGLQRRLLDYVRRKVEELGAMVLLTTHSASVIDMFSGSDDSQILHVTHDGDSSEVSVVSSHDESHGVLGDLDVRASDILQANGIVWVEGISDVVFVRRWLSLYCQKHGIRVPVEGSEFAFMEYGGRCLSHFDFRAIGPDDLAERDAEWLLPALALSRHTFVVMDSDRRSASSTINSTKKKVLDSAEFSWVTEGREIENYLTAEMCQALIGATVRKYDSFATVYKKARGVSYYDKKKGADAAVGLMTLDNWENRDLENQIGRMVEAIASWNPNWKPEVPT